MSKEDATRIAPKSEAKDLCGPVITIVVGEKKFKVVIHKAILIKSSKFFEKAVKAEWSTSRPDPDTIELEHMDLDTFKLYVYWIYFGAIKLPKEDSDFLYVLLAKAYVLGEEFMDVKFKNDVLDTIIYTLTEYDDWPTGESVTIVYNGTTETSTGRRLMVDVYAWYMNNYPSCTQVFKNCPKDFLVDVIAVLAEGDCIETRLSSKTLYYEEEPTS